MILIHAPYPVVVVDPLAIATFVFAVFTALGTVGSTVVALWLGLSAYNASKSRKTVEVELELRREAELQAVLIRIDGNGFSQQGDTFTNMVRIFNGSDKLIYDVHLGLTVDGSRSWAQPIPFVNPRQEQVASIRLGKGAPPQVGFGTFVDAYGRKWSVDDLRGLKLESAVPITASSEASAALGSTAE